MRQWQHGGGFSFDASVVIDASDRAGLERLLRYCARPAFSVERLSWHTAGERLVYRLPKPRPGGQDRIELGVSELLDRLAALVPLPRRHRHRYNGVLAPNAPLRGAVTARAGQPIGSAALSAHTTAAYCRSEGCKPTRASYLWAALIARISAIAPALLYLPRASLHSYECLPLQCPRCGNEMRLIAFTTEPGVVKPILLHLGLPPDPPTVAPARGPPLLDINQTLAFDPTDPEPVLEYEFDQTVSW